MSVHVLLNLLNELGKRDKMRGLPSILSLFRYEFNKFNNTLTPTYLYCEFAFRAHFQCVVRTYDLKCVENANQLVSTQGKIMNIHMRW